MGVVLTWLRLELRRRWRSLAALALLVAFATATVLASVAGARRGATAVDRLYAETLPATLTVLPNQPHFDWARIRALPEVAALTTFPVSGFGVQGVPPADSAGSFPPGDDEGLRTIEVPRVLEGRLPDPRRADEVVVGSQYRQRYGKGVGDRLVLMLMTPEQAAREDYDSSAEEPAGPRITVTIVGVIRSAWYSEDVGQSPGVLSSPALYRTYPTNFVDPDKGYINALVRLKNGVADEARFRADLARVTGRNNIDVWNNYEKFGGNALRATTFEAACLLAFGLAALAAAIVLVGQSVARYTAATVSDLRVLRAVGLSPRQALASAAAGPFLAAVVGATAGVAGAAAASMWMPIGAAALREPDPGLDLDWLVLGTGWLLTSALVLAGSAAAAALFLSAGATAGRRSAVALLASRMGLPVPMVVGARFALEPGSGRAAVPVRPALVGAVAGVLGVLAAFTFSAGVKDAAANPVRFGRTHQLEAYLGFNGEDFVPAPAVLSAVFAAVAGDPAVQSVEDARSGVAESAGRTPGRKAVSVTTYTYAPVGGRAFPAVLTEGRLPARADEIVLAPFSARDLQVGVGDRISLKGGAKPTRMTVTGIGFVPAGPHNDRTDGGWITAAGDKTLYAGANIAFKFHGALVALRPGTDPAAVAGRLNAAVKAAGGEYVTFREPDPLGEIPQIRDVEELPLLLAVFLGLLATGALGHALATAVRRRRHEVAVLRALGMTRWQSRWTVVTQATLVAGIGLLFGVPLGVALGRTLWRLLADMWPLQYLAPLAAGAVLLVWPLTLAIANALAAWPGTVAARLRIAHVLRAE
ncbi:FtsX-like permease family protein [Microbispora sp. RL4-1S]|uniref:FtsX-like permease family protein n=1 Tax=Microbispora oryzae TaxID=2806554 RepID=A0A940WJI1_9ACTN|nr:FtsX-like permease family protein [Microbispora oryzae]MBP2702321.1 FtsX-like permease family protein [Microbispora oryzae]